MHWNKKKEDRTPEDYQKKANEQIQELKNQWKTFFRTGPIVIAAAIVMIALSIAWFVSNTKVDATGVQISAAGSEFDLAAAKACLTGLCGAEAPVLAAVSGGLDSMCLLHLLATWGRERNLNVAAAHFNHQLRGAESDRDERFVRDWCDAHAIPFVSGRGDVRALAARKGLSLEEAAREARYAFLNQQKTALGCRCVLTAHHADDNVAQKAALHIHELAGNPPHQGA